MRNGTAPIDAKCRDRLAKYLSDWWGYSERAVKDVFPVGLNPDSKSPGAGMCLNLAVLTMIRKWAESYSKALAREELFLRERVGDFVAKCIGVIAESSPMEQDYRSKGEILRSLAASEPCGLNPDDCYKIIGSEKKPLTIRSLLSHEEGTAAFLPGDPDATHLADWILEPVAGQVKKFRIKSMVIKLDLTDEVSKAGPALCLRKAANTEWLDLQTPQRKPLRDHKRPSRLSLESMVKRSHYQIVRPVRMTFGSGPYRRA